MSAASSKRLQGKRVVVTRSSSQSGELSGMLAVEGAEVLELPLIEVKRASDPQTLDDAFNTLATYEWIVFTSTNGVRYFMELFLDRFDDIRAVGPARFACVGASTARVLAQWHLACDLMPDQANAEALGTALVETGSLDSAQVLVVTGNRNRDVLPKMLSEEGRAIVDTLQVYATELSALETLPQAQAFREAGAHAITFTSSSTAESFAKQAEHLQLQSYALRPLTISIGSQTSQTMIAKGMPVNAEASQPTLEALVDAVVKALK